MLTVAGILSPYILLSYYYNPSNYSDLYLFFHLVPYFIFMRKKKTMIGITLDCNGIYDTTRILRYGDIYNFSWVHKNLQSYSVIRPHIYLSNK